MAYALSGCNFFWNEDPLPTFGPTMPAPAMRRLVARPPRRYDGDGCIPRHVQRDGFRAAVRALAERRSE